MATGAGKKKLARKVSVSASDFNLPPVPVDVVPVRGSFEEELVGWIAAVVLVALMLPMLGMLYLDILDAKHEAKVQLEKVEKLRREIEREKRDKKPDTFSDNPVFDRVRRPLPLSLPRPTKLGKSRM
jgi:hypothetical protein